MSGYVGKPTSIPSLGAHLYSVGIHHSNLLKSPVTDYEQGDLFYSVGPHGKLL